MTEASEDSCLVRVRAQVMCRDEGTGGWVALGAGGLADVMVGKRRRRRLSGTDESNGEAQPNVPSGPGLGFEYYIHGKRISDSLVVLQCTIKKDFQYNKVMPTFHHWVTDEKRYGLTFQTAADARAFDKGVRIAIEELLNGLGGAWPSLHAYKKRNPASRYDDEDGEIFECLDLPTDSRSSSDTSQGSRHRRHDITQTPILSAITLPHHQANVPEQAKPYEVLFDDKIQVQGDDGDSCPYVHLQAIHEYTYPHVGPGVIPGSEKSSPNIKPPLLKRETEPPPLPDKKPTTTIQARLRCRHCHELYLESANRAGACEYAPDYCLSCINCFSCMKCAQCMVYHCMADSEGDYGLHPCECNKPDDACAKRWLGVALLSLLVPCLCCYLPLRCMHRGAKALRLTGGHHAPFDSP